MSTLDTSLLVAAIAPEEDAAAAMEQIDGERHLITSRVVAFEAVAALRRMRGVPVADATTIVQEFLARAGVSVEALASDIYLEALHAWEVYGKGSGHPARLNLGDCFSYAMAKREGGRLLYKGNDFSQTDLG